MHNLLLDSISCVMGFVCQKKVLSNVGILYKYRLAKFNLEVFIKLTNWCGLSIFLVGHKTHAYAWRLQRGLNNNDSGEYIRPACVSNVGLRNECEWITETLAAEGQTFTKSGEWSTKINITREGFAFKPSLVG